MVNQAERTHNPRVIAGTLAGFEGFQRFRTMVIDPLRDLLPVAVEVESVPSELGATYGELLSARGFFVDDRDHGVGRLRLAGPLDRFLLLEGIEDDQPPGFRDLASVVARAVQSRFAERFDIPHPGGVLRLEHRPLVMGVLNLTPDSFSDGGGWLHSDRAIERAFKLAEDGADIVDVGAESTRPGAQKVSVEEELERLDPVLKVICRQLPVPVSVDTMKSEVAEMALERGASVINDVSGLESDPRLAEVVARRQGVLVINHMQGTPQSMQDAPGYTDATAEICRSLRERLEFARRAGIAEERILLDPGIGFGKRPEDNVDLLARIGELRSLGRPLLIGCSRKSFLGHLTGRSVEERGAATAATTALLSLRGVKMIRVHDVRETVDILKVLDAIDEHLRLD